MVIPTRELRPARSAGMLLHPTSLPGPFGIGDLGPSAFAWVATLAHAKQTWWQMLPLGPTGYGDSPYQSLSAFAGNLNLISPQVLLEDGLLKATDLETANIPADHVDFGRVIEWKTRLLKQAWQRFQSGSAPSLRPLFEEFCTRQADWLADFALFMALKDAHGGKSWLQWPQELLLRKPEAIEGASKQLHPVVDLYKLGQFLFFRQWSALKRYANNQGIRLIGDIPIFVAGDSADVWAHPELFLLNKDRRPTVVAGVPPDYFSQTGQLWGNPLYNWEVMKQTNYAWWIARLRALLQQVDFIRLDHFRGLEAYWEIPAGMPTAQVGRWVKGPGADLLETLRTSLGSLPLIAEDLGVITPEVEKLRLQFGLPGMRILQFAFGGAQEDRFLPHNYEHNTVVYTGTHDNETTCGWYNSLSEKEAAFLERYAPGAGRDISWELMRLAWASVADYAIAPLQDVLSLGNEARMNQPGKPSGNWRWCFRSEMLTTSMLDSLGLLTETYKRSARPRDAAAID